MKSSRLSTAALALLIHTTLLAVPFSALAHPSITHAEKALSQGQPNQALTILNSAPSVQKGSPAYFFTGAKILNRLGRPADALTLLAISLEQGYLPRGFYYESGWALLETGQISPARDYLEKHLRDVPGDANALVLLGRALYAEGRLGEAEKKLQTAFLTKPALNQGWAALTMLSIQQQRGRSITAAEFWRTAQTDPAVRSAVQDRVLTLASSTTSPSTKAWTIALTLGGGYNSNVVGLADGLLLPTDISNKGAGFARTVLDGFYRWYFGAHDSLTAGAVFQADIFDGAGAADLIDHFFYLTWLHDFGSGVTGSFRISDEFTLVGEESFRNQVGLRPGLAKLWQPGLATELAFPIAVNDYYFPTNAIQDRDGTAYGPTLSQFWTVPGTSWQTRLTYLFTRNESNGSDFQFNSHAVALGLDGTLPWQIALSLAYAISFDDYDKRNSLTGFTQRRQDTIQSVYARVSRPVFWENFTVYFQYNFTDNDSNINFYRYDQHVWSGGVQWRY